MMVSPTAAQKQGDQFGRNPVGAGEYRFVKWTAGDSLRYERFPDYYRGAPKLDKVILRPIPEVTARMAALRSGEVNWIEVPSPDEVPALKSEGYQVLTNFYSHVWPWVYDTTKPPFDKVEVRQALNYAIDRDTMSTALLNGTGAPATQYLPPSDLGDSPEEDYFTYDPDKAKQMLADAGYPNGFSFKLSYPTSGSGNMLPGPMNEELQADLAKIGVKVELDPIEWGAMLGDFFTGKIPGGDEAINISLGFVLPSLWNAWFNSTSSINAGKFSDPAADALMAKAAQTLDPTARGAVFNELNKVLIQDSPWLLVVNDLNPRVLAPNVKGFVMPRSWYVDLTQVYVQ
jgi:peptide/nickel transport system substrate-binding protein